ncbi:MAG TPA: hypothetical protein VFE05_22980 [Longimicrobiaceae bacterium]|nr:hypothetical protein [Longimicrobiaceae bacterium]
MMNLRTLRGPALALAAAAAVLAPSGARAQSLLASRGLGYSLEPMDARARALGGIGLGLPGANFSLVNPAGTVGLAAPALVIAFQPDFYRTETSAGRNTGTTARFPLIHAVFPIGRRFAGSVGYGSFLDQHWQTETSDTVLIGGTPRGVKDRFLSAGAVARLRVGGGYLLSSRLAVGAAVDVLTGSARDSVTRTFTDSASTLAATVYGTDWSYGGVGFAGGVRWNPVEPVNLSVAVAGGGHIRADAGSDTLAANRTYPRPIAVDLGASGRVAPNTTLAVAGRWMQWSKASDALVASGGARDLRSASAGVEFGGFSLGGRNLPLRVGGRWTELPFAWGTATTAGEFPTEKALSAGLGARLAGGAALVDFTGERGKRAAGAAFDESYWRLSLSLTLLGR